MIKTTQAALSLKGLKEVRRVIDNDVHIIIHLKNTPSANSNNNNIMTKKGKRKSELYNGIFVEITDCTHFIIGRRRD